MSILDSLIKQLYDSYFDYDRESMKKHRKQLDNVQDILESKFNNIRTYSIRREMFYETSIQDVRIRGLMLSHFRKSVESFVHLYGHLETLRFHLEDVVVVADSGLMTKKNVLLLQMGKYKYILGARIRNEAKDIREWILSQAKEENTYLEYEKTHTIPAPEPDDPKATKEIKERLIITYSKDRAKNDADNRKRGVERLRLSFGSGTIKKESINRRGYNKFLEITNDIDITINEDKIKDDEKWDGWKGYITNTDIEAKEVVSQYHGLWVVERAFRVTKGNLEARPVFHFTSRRIEAHICICFIAYKVYKELERIMKLMKFPMSVDKALEIAKTIPTVTMRLPYNQQKLTQTLFLTDEQRAIKPLFDLKKYFG